MGCRSLRAEHMFEENYDFYVPQEKRIKVILDSDVRNEVDDQFAIMHALMTPKFDVRGVIAAHFGHDRIRESMEASVPIEPVAPSKTTFFILNPSINPQANSPGNHP